MRVGYLVDLSIFTLWMKLKPEITATAPIAYPIT
jgi:hypothetical protein